MANEHVTRQEAKKRIRELEEAAKTLLKIAIDHPHKNVGQMQDIEDARDTLREGIDFDMEATG